MTTTKPQALYSCQHEGCTEGNPAGHFLDNYDARRLYCNLHTSERMMAGSRTTKDKYGKKDGRRRSKNIGVDKSGK